MLTILGNILFLVGSVAFLDEAWEMTGVWLFIVGSVFMVIDSYRQRLALRTLQQQLERATFTNVDMFMPASDLTKITTKPARRYSQNG